MSGVANNVQGSTIFSGNTVTGGPNDVVVNDELVQGDLTIDGTLVVSNVDITQANFSGDVLVKGDVEVQGNLLCDGAVTANMGLIATNACYLNGDVNIGGVADVGALVVEGGALMKAGASVTALSGTALSVTGDTRVAGDLYVSGNAYVDGEVISGTTPDPVTSVFTLGPVTTYANLPYTTPGTGQAICKATISGPATPAPCVITFSNVSLDLVYNTSPTLKLSQGKSTTNTYKYGVCQLPFNGVVDGRFKTGATITYSWQCTWNGTDWVGSHIGDSQAVITSVSADIVAADGDEYGVVLISGSSPSDKIVINAFTNSGVLDDNWIPGDINPMPNQTTAGQIVPGEKKTNSEAYAQFIWSVGPGIAYPVYGLGTPVQIAMATTDKFYYFDTVFQSVSSPSPGIYKYIFYYNSTTNGVMTVPKICEVYTQNQALLTYGTNGAVTGSIVTTQSVSAERVVNVGKTLALDRPTNTLACSANFGVNTIQNVAGTQSFSVASVAQLNAGFNADRRAAVLNANNPTALNPFATIADIGGGGGGLPPGGTVDGAIQYRYLSGATPIFAASDEYTFDPPTKRQRNADATNNTQVDVTPTQITLNETSLLTGQQATLTKTALTVLDPNGSSVVGAGVVQTNNPTNGNTGSLNYDGVIFQTGSGVETTTISNTQVLVQGAFGAQSTTITPTTVTINNGSGNLQCGTINGSAITTVGLTWPDFNGSNAYANLPSNRYEVSSGMNATYLDTNGVGNSTNLMLTAGGGSNPVMITASDVTLNGVSLAAPQTANVSWGPGGIYLGTYSWNGGSSITLPAAYKSWQVTASLNANGFTHTGGSSETAKFAIRLYDGFSGNYFYPVTYNASSSVYCADNIPANYGLCLTFTDRIDLTSTSTTNFGIEVYWENTLNTAYSVGLTINFAQL